MREYRDLAEPTRTATAALCVYWAVRALYLLVPRDAGSSDALAMVALATGLVMILCFVLVGRWFYRANSNAHALAPERMTIGPGWSVGWHFVPFANLVLPYLAVREAWRASHWAAGREERIDSALLPGWWALWLGSSLVDAAATLLEMSFGDRGSARYVELAAVALEAPLCLVLIALMRRLARVQAIARQVSTFS
jgi:hypothetical protein